MAVGMLTVVLKAVFGLYWTNLLNRIVTLVLATAIPPVALYALGNGEWGVLVLGAINGVIVAGSLLGVNEVYKAKLAAEERQLYRE